MDRTIILSSGRCGSTLLSDLLSDEPDTLSAQEFFVCLPDPEVLGGETLSGPAYWDLLSSPRPQMRTLARLGISPSEEAYPPGGAWRGRLTELPRLLAVTLPRLTTDPDALFDRLAGPVRAFPAQSATAHHRRLLDTMADMLGRTHWVERSGGSSLTAPYLVRSFPEARFVYLTRDWTATATSMSRHSAFRLLMLRTKIKGTYGIDPFEIRPGQAIPAEAEQFLPERLSADFLPAPGQDIDRYVVLCAFMHGQVEQAIAEHRPARLLRMTYEDLRADPARELATLGDFLGLADPDGWAARVAPRVKPQEVPA